MATVLLPRVAARALPGRRATPRRRRRDRRRSHRRARRGPSRASATGCVESGPRLRPHINVFVDGEPADLTTPVGASADGPRDPRGLGRRLSPTLSGPGAEHRANGSNGSVRSATASPPSARAPSPGAIAGDRPPAAIGEHVERRQRARRPPRAHARARRPTARPVRAPAATSAATRAAARVSRADARGPARAAHHERGLAGTDQGRSQDVRPARPPGPAGRRAR